MITLPTKFRWSEVKCSAGCTPHATQGEVEVLSSAQNPSAVLILILMPLLSKLRHALSRSKSPRVAHRRHQSSSKAGPRQGRTQQRSPSPARESVRDRSSLERGRRRRRDASVGSETSEDGKLEPGHRRLTVQEEDEDRKEHGARIRQKSHRIPREVHVAPQKTNRKKHPAWTEGESVGKENVVNRGAHYHAYPHHQHQMDPFQEMMARLEEVLPTNPPAQTYAAVSPPAVLQGETDSGPHAGQRPSPVLLVGPKYSRDSHSPGHQVWAPAAPSLANQHHPQQFDKSNHSSRSSHATSMQEQEPFPTDWKSDAKVGSSGEEKEPLPGTWKFENEHALAEKTSSLMPKQTSPLGLAASILQDMQVLLFVSYAACNRCHGTGSCIIWLR